MKRAGIILRVIGIGSVGTGAGALGVLLIAAGVSAVVVVRRRKAKSQSLISAVFTQRGSAPLQPAVHTRTVAALQAGIAKVTAPRMRSLSVAIPDGTPIVLFDLETTGLRSDHDRIVEIAAQKFSGNLLIDDFHSLVNPGSPIPPKVSEVNGITDAMVIDAPSALQIVPQFLDWIDGCVLVAYNAAFDIGFLHAASVAAGRYWPGYVVIDGWTLARHTLPKNATRDLKLESLATYFRADQMPNHRAYNDVQSLAAVFQGLVSMGSGIDAAANQLGGYFWRNYRERRDASDLSRLFTVNGGWQGSA